MEWISLVLAVAAAFPGFIVAAFVVYGLIMFAVMFLVLKKRGGRYD